MIDQLFINEAPTWVNSMYESLEHDVIAKLKVKSSVYDTIVKRINKIYETYPDFARIVENENEQKELYLTPETASALAELITAECTILEMMQRVLYIRGIKDGILFAQQIELL